jgi:subtilisin-like proprotein convertase family protein
MRSAVRSPFLSKKRFFGGLSSHKLWLILACPLFLAALAWPQATSALEAHGIAAAWERARQAGVYDFSADIKQTVVPQPTVRNVGRASKGQALHLEGKTDLPQQQLHLTLWSQGGSVLNASSGVQVKVEGDQAYARQGSQGWEEINNFMGAFAPQGDFMAYMAAAKDVQETPLAVRNSQPATCYTFRIDGPSYARHLRDQMEKHLAERGELPPGATLDLPENYVTMTGDGELWVGADGLPMRQVLRLRFPPRPDGQEISADVTVDFRFDQALTSRTTSPFPSIIHHAQPSGRLPSLLALILGGLSLAFCALLVTHSRSRRLYTALALVIITSLVITPFLQSVQAAGFREHQAARTREAEAREQESSVQRTLATLMTESDHHPNVDPLASQRTGEPADYGISSAEYGVLTAPNDNSNDANSNNTNDCDPDDPADTDDDGLTEGNECVLGTNPEEDDTDGDNLTDGQEVAGFDYNGKTWYTNPLEMDTNGDGLDDGTEWNTGHAEDENPSDMDGDGTPDLFDRDNDGDGVPDGLDTSPYYAGDTTFNDDQPFQLVLDSLTEGQPTFVEFQLRPTNPDHLWYALNVLDWPAGDDQGQLQDKDGATFYDVDDTTDRSPNDNGDVKLVPMLEIKISGKPDNLPPEEDLEPYGISIQELDDEGDNIVAYVPLQLVVDQKGDEHVAFAGKMRYQPAAEWGNAHQVRLVWAVQMLVDVCAEYKDGHCVEYDEMNDSQIVHVYGDDWTLTGLDVREEHGTDYDVIYEDPAIDPDRDDDSNLLYLTYGLERTFLAGSDCEDIDSKGTDDPDDDVCLGGDGERDITLEEIYNRWNHATNAGVSDEKRWSLDDTFTVMTYTYGTIDEALITLASTETKKILDDDFTTCVPVTPTLLFAREERFRGVNLDQQRSGDDAVQWSEDNPRQLILVLDPDDVPVETVAGLNWAPYRYEDGEWSAYPIEEYWDELHQRYTAAFAGEYDDEDDPDEVRGGAAIMGQIHYLSLYLGVNVTIQSGDELLTQTEYQTYDKPIWSRLAGLGGAAVVFIVNKVLMSGFYQSTLALRALYYFMQKQRFSTAHELAGTAFGAIKGKFGTWWSTGHRWRAGFAGATALVILGLIITGVVFLAKGFFADKPAAKITAAVLVGALLLAGMVILPIFQAVNLVKTFQSVYDISASAAAGRVLGKSAKFIGISKKAAVVGLIISVGVVWGIFIYALVKEDIPAGSVAFDMLLAQTIAATVVAIILFALSLTIVGTIIVGIVTVIDIILVILGVKWTISGALTDAITKAIFAYEIAIDLEDEDLVQMGRLNNAFVHPEIGMVAGNEMEFSTTITTTVTHEDPKGWRARAYVWLYSKDQLRSTTFRYALAPGEKSLSARLNQVKGDWDVGKDHKFRGHQMYTGWKADEVSTVTTLQTGINRAVDLTLTTAYAIPGVECWTLYWWFPLPPFIIVVPICFNRGVDGSMPTDMGDSIILDVLPPTLDEFVDVTTWADGMVFRDADGDGLLAQTFNGNDPGDTTWDTDGDGLSDAWELDRSSVAADEGGEFFDPRDPDTDDDGLDDREEVLAGTNPNNGDTDGDTISDTSEVDDGWAFTYAVGKTVRVYSDPLQTDADGDGMDDLFERTLHTCPGCDPLENRYHPYVWNTNPVGLYAEVGDPDDVVRPGQTFVYTTTVQNNVKPDLWVRGNTELSTTPVAFQGGPLDMFFDIARDQSQSLYSDLTVPVGTGNQDVDLSTAMVAQLHTPSIWAWDPQRASSYDTATGIVPEGVVVTLVDGWTVPYVVAALENDRVYIYPATADGITGSGVHAIGWTGDESNAPPDVACNDDGECLVVWTSHYTPGNEDYFRWRRVLPTLEVTGTVETVTAPAGECTYGGAVASDGDSFLVAWMEGTVVSRTLKVNHVNAYGTPSTPTLSLDSGALGAVDVAYAYDRYQVVWERDGDVYAAEVSGSDVTTYTVATTSAIESQPRIAYDALGHRSLVVYLRQVSGKRYPRARVLTGGHVGEDINLSGAFGNLTDPVDLSVSADPVNGGWITAWARQNSTSIAYRAVGMNGELRGERPLSRPGGRNVATDVACTRPRPIAQLLFDEDAGATDFADSSGFGNDGFCTDDGDYDCPLSGVGGKEGNAVQFDGDKDVAFVPMDVSETAYAVTLWFKATCQTCGMFEVSNNYVPGTGGYNADRTIYLKNGNVCTRLGNRFAKAGGGSTNSCGGHENCETICSSGTNYGDGNWHQVAHTFGGSVDGQRLYVDGELQASGEQDFSDLDVGDRLRIGYGEYQYGTYFAGAIDEVTVYPRTLSEGEVRDAYRAALVVYPFDEAEGATTFENVAHNGYTASCQGSACPTAGVGGRAYAAAEFDGGNDVIRVGNQARTLAEYVYDFEDGVPGVWNTVNWSHSPNGNRAFLGRFGNDSVSLNLPNLPTHDWIEVEFDLFVIDTWDGNASAGGNGPDYWELRADGGQQLRTTFSNFDPPYDYQFYPDQPWSPSGATLYSTYGCTGNSYHLAADKADLPIYWRMRCFDPGDDTVVVFYWNNNYGGSTKWCDGKRYAESGIDCRPEGEFGNGSARVWAAANPGFRGASERNSLGYSPDAVYHIKRSFDHVDTALQLTFGGSNLESLDNESWGLDNVRVRVINSNVPLANSSFTVAFWAKREADGADYVLSQGETSDNQGLHIGFRDNDQFTCAFYSDDLNTSGTYADSDWHHWACTYDADTRTRIIYRDGTEVAQDTASANYQGSGPLQIGRGLWDGARAFEGRLDELVVWRDALTASEIETLYDKVKALDDSVTECALPRAAQGDDRLYVNRLALRETTTYLGKTEQDNTDTVTVDGTLPDSTITSLAVGQRLNVTGTLIIGGEARDNTFVAQVEVSVDGGPWETAEGAETWTYAWNTGVLTDGSHIVQSRATDAGGNVQSPPDSVTVVIDRTPPQLAAGTPPLKAGRDVQERWAVSLGGVITDANPSTVEVLLEGQNGVAGMGWQQAAVAGNTWSLDYVLSGFDNAENALAEPTGVYTLSLRAEDVPGNQALEAVYPPPVPLDNTAPEIGLAYPYTDTAVLTDTAVFITGVVTDVGSVVNGVGRVEIAFVNSEEESPTVTWHDALLAQPGAVTSTWAYTVPALMEGFYEIYLRGTDVLDNRNDRQSTWIAWQGGIDTQAPLVDASVLYNVMGIIPDLTHYSDVTCLARDLNLRGDAFLGCPCDPSTWQLTTYDQVSPWYRETFSDTTHLYEIQATCTLLGQFVTPPTIEACDIGERCSQTTLTETVKPTPIIDSVVFTPTDGVVFTTTNPFDVEGKAFASFTLDTLTVTVNGSTWYNPFIGGGVFYEWSQSFDPETDGAGDGHYQFLSTVSDNSDNVQTIFHPVTFTVDSQPPITPTFDTTVVTTAHRTEGGVLFLTGVVTDLVEVRQVQVNRDPETENEGWRDASHDGTNWRYLWPSVEEDSDGVTYTVSVRAMDVVSHTSHTSQVTETVTFDMVLPELVTLTLKYLHILPPAQYPLEPGQIVTDSSLLRIAWTPSDDGSGVNGYRAGWTAGPTDTAGLTFTPHTAASAYSVTQAIGEAQTVHAHVVSMDNTGNARHQTLGPVYVDGPRTPDIVDLGYHGWMASNCSLMGIDRRVDRHAMDGASLSEEQRFYTTWNSDTLRLAWKGANWNYEGDLFIYFDTESGGATTLYNPYTATVTTTIYLPGNYPAVDTSGWPEFEQVRPSQLITPLLDEGMKADHLVWVAHELTATLMTWNGSAWVTPTQLTSDTYHLDTCTGLADLYLPFSTLGITRPVSAGMNLLAVASEEDALRLWATMPHRNLVNSRLSVGPLAATVPVSEHVFALARAFRWISLGSGICPNDPLEALTGERYPDNDLRVDVHTDPIGTTYALLADDLYHQWKALFQGQGPRSEHFDFLDHNHPPLGQGSTVTYTLGVANRGTLTATDVQVLVSSYYALHLPGGTRNEAGYREHQMVNVGDVAPGATATATFTGVVEVEANWRYTRCLTIAGLPEETCRPLLQWAALDGLVFDSRYPITPTIVVTIPLSAPLEWLWADHPVDIEPPLHVGLDPLAVVGQLTHTLTGYASDPSGVPLIEVEVRDSAAVTTTLTCPDATPDDGRWSCGWIVSGADGDAFDLRARATDGFGHVGEWTSPWRTVVLDSTSPTVTLDIEARETVSGQLVGPDGYLLTGVFTDSHSQGMVDVCREAEGDTTCDPATIVLSTQAPTDTAHFYDDIPGAPVAVGAACLTRTFAVSESFIVGDVNLGLTAAISNREELVAHLFSPAGTGARVIHGVGNDANVYAHYDVWLDDAAPGELHNSADDDPAEPYFDRAARPDAALNSFDGEGSQGTWTLRLCDLLPLVNSGTYHRARLSLTPQSNALSSAGTWAYGLPTPGGNDGVTQTLSIYGRDVLGNRATEPITLEYRLDTVAPALTVTAVVTRIPLVSPSPALTGTVTDGGGLEEVYTRVDPPDGASYRDAVDRADDDWHFTPRLTTSGTHALWLEAYDQAGNVTTSGPYAVTGVCTPVQSISITGPATTISGTPVTLEAAYVPTDATWVELLWDNGTTGSSTRYILPEGVYTAVVTATAACGAPVTATHTVTSTCTEVQSVSISGPTTALSGTAIVLTASYLPADATDVVLEWDNGGTGPSAAYTWTEGIHTAVVTATAACGDPVTATHTATVTTTCTPVQSVSVAGPATALSGTVISLVASYLPVDATGVTLKWNNGTTGPNASYTWPEGVHTAVVTATAACGDPITATHTVTVTTTCTPVQSVSVAGPTSGYTGTIYAFTATVQPPDATPPITYTWQATEQSQVTTTTLATSHTVSFAWTTTGTKTVTATAQNCAGTGWRRGSVTLIVQEAGPYDVFLPLVFRDY